jgi:hypothetical protein
VKLTGTTYTDGYVSLHIGDDSRLRLDRWDGTTWATRIASVHKAAARLACVSVGDSWEQVCETMQITGPYPTNATARTQEGT